MKEKRICNICKKPMFTSHSGEWRNGMFVDIHEKCKKKERKKFETWRIIYPNGTESMMNYDPEKREQDKLKKFKDREKKIMEWHKDVVTGLVNGLSHTHRDGRLDDINFWRSRSDLFDTFAHCVLNILTDQTFELSEKELISISNEGYKK